MTFEKFETLFLGRYPEGSVAMHGKFGGTEGNRKVAVTFDRRKKVYEYYGAYEDILCRVGIPTISKARLHSAELTLKRYREDHGKNYSLFGNKPMDYSREIAEWEAIIADYKARYTII